MSFPRRSNGHVVALESPGAADGASFFVIAQSHAAALRLFGSNPLAVELPGFAAPERSIELFAAGRASLPPPRLPLRASRVSGPPLVPRPEAGGGAAAGPRAAGLRSFSSARRRSSAFLTCSVSALPPVLLAHHIGGQFQIGLLRSRLRGFGGLNGRFSRRRWHLSQSQCRGATGNRTRLKRFLANLGAFFRLRLFDYRRTAGSDTSGRNVLIAR